MRVIDQENGKEVILDRTEELNADLSQFYEVCEHTRRELRQRVTKGGGTQYIDQCLRCGNSVGLFRKHSTELQTVPAWDEELDKLFRSSRERERATIIQKHVRIQRDRTEGFWKEYKIYLGSSDWQQKRKKVFERANGQCEGCREKLATQVHHLTYAHVYAEFLFELVAVCDECDHRLHLADDEDAQSGNQDAQSKDRGLEELTLELEMLHQRLRPCDGCRYESEKGDKAWCFQYDISAEVALSHSGECGPSRNSFDPLR